MFFETSEPMLIENCEKKLEQHAKSERFPQNTWIQYSIYGVAEAQDPPLENASFDKFISQQSQTLLKISSFMY